MRSWACIALLAPALFPWGAGFSLQAADRSKLTPAELEFFESKIRPVLADNCYKCHSQGAEKIKGGLLLDTRDGVLKGGNTGPAIVPGQPEKSLLLTA
ncbi:MAG TPA: c-type cytochrome domain-containing protein, partial [Candidatus Saccharimonadales bacterium]|nr:c-type cytochrome domain-containing protein [Candidatus Saccharimonadales bacterium]